jgi:hypothetical protein
MPQVAWNKGLSKETDERVAQYARVNVKSHLGQVAWNKGKTAATDERVMKFTGSGNGLFGKIGVSHPVFGTKRPGEKSAFFGKHHSDSTKKRISDTWKILSPKYVKRGPDHPNWNPDLTQEERIVARKRPEIYEWRTLVYQRDDYTCQACGKRGVRLTAHHLYDYKRYPSYRTSPDNGVCLCKVCHEEFHSSLGGYHAGCTPMALVMWAMDKQ